MLRRRRHPALALTVPVAALIALGLAGCGEPHRPFGRDGEPAATLLVRPLTGVTVAVLPVEGMPRPLAAEVADVLADGFAAREVPARVAMTGALAGEPRLFGQVMNLVPDADSDTLLVDITLELREPGGRPLMIQTLRDRIPGALWSTAAADADQLRLAAERLAAPAVAGFANAEQALVPVPSGEHEGLSQKARPQAQSAALAALPAVALGDMTGAPGGAGNQVLSAAMRSVLREVGVPLALSEAPQAQVTAEVALAPVPGNAQERIRVVWRVLDASGEEVGTVAQENLLPRGYAEQNWPDLAFLIAGAAVDGVVPLLQQMAARAAP